MKLSARIFVAALALMLFGCSNSPIVPGANFESSVTVTAQQLKEAADGQEHFMYIVTDEKYHYFRDEEGYYKLSSSVSIPSSMVLKMEVLNARGVKPGFRGISVQFDGDKIVHRRRERNKTK